MSKLRTILDIVMMTSISAAMLYYIDTYINTKHIEETTLNVSKWEHERDSIINTCFEIYHHDTNGIRTYKVDVRLDIIKNNITPELALYPIFTINKDKSLNGHILLALNEIQFIKSFACSNYVDTITVSNSTKCKEFVTHYQTNNEAVVLSMMYIDSAYSLVEQILYTIAHSDSSFISFKTEYNDDLIIELDSNRINFAKIVHEICVLSRNIELQLLKYDNTLQLDNGRYIN